MDKATDSRTAILERLRHAGAPDPGLPDSVPSGRIAGDKLENFQRNLEAYDGEHHVCATREEALQWIRQATSGIEKVYTAVDGLAGCAEPADAAEAQQIDVAVVEATLGAGETGSVWLTRAALGNCGAVLFSDHVYVLLNRACIVDGISTAYAELNRRGWADLDYGSWFTGPSATADIEAVRVVGAQGPRALTVVVYGTEKGEDSGDA